MNNNALDQNGITSSTEQKSAENACCGIYGLQNRLKPDKWYIGQTHRTFDVRWKDYEKFRVKSQPKIYHALKKYGYDGFNKVIIEACPLHLLNDRETYWIQYYDSVKLGYNLDSGGGQNKRLSEETKRKLSVAHTGKKLSVEHKKNLGDAARGSKRTDEARKNISDSLKGMKYPPWSQEHKRKLQEYYSQRRQSISIFSLDGKLIETISGVNTTIKKYSICPKTLLRALKLEKPPVRGRCKDFVFRRNSDLSNVKH